MFVNKNLVKMILIASKFTNTYTKKISKILVVFRVIERYSKVLYTSRVLIVKCWESFFLYLEQQRRDIEIIVFELSNISIRLLSSLYFSIDSILNLLFNNWNIYITSYLTQNPNYLIDSHYFSYLEVLVILGIPGSLIYSNLL